MPLNGNATREISCPKCKAKIVVKIVDMKPGTTIGCPSCLAKITFSGDDIPGILKAGEDRFKSAIADFNKRLGK
jgi:hypothetical protein